SSIFDAFVGEVQVIAISFKRAKSPCQQSSTGLSDSACTRIQHQTGRRPLVNSLRLVCRILLAFALSVKRVEDPYQVFSILL
ncbi:MAG: hypothetical protein FWC11_06780, partial [Firmicutes bacterium]|nr:hypothetical protein [Bacillota bacterium]